MSFDLDRSLRRRKPQRRAGQPLRQRGRDALAWIDGAQPGREHLFDTCVYIDLLHGRAPPLLLERLERMRVRHSAVAMAELTHAFGRLAPDDVRTAPALENLGRLISSIDERRIDRPSVQAFAEAGMLAGLAVRLTGRAHGSALLNDALLLLQAAETGCFLLTRNAADFDLLQQLAPDAHVTFYEAAERSAAPT